MPDKTMYVKIQFTVENLQAGDELWLRLRDGTFGLVSPGLALAPVDPPVDAAPAPVGLTALNVETQGLSATAGYTADFRLTVPVGVAADGRRQRSRTRSTNTPSRPLDTTTTPESKNG